MKTWVLWTHYECDVYASLHTSYEAAYRYLASGWLEDCSEDDCGHDENIGVEGSTGEIADALEYHYDALSYDITEMEVPEEQIEVTTERIVNPVMVSDDQTYDLMSRLETFSEQP